MSLPRQTSIRLPKLKKGLILGQNLAEIARECHVTERTINRDKEAWLASGDFEVWLRDEWLRYHMLIGKTDPVEAYRQLSRLIGKTLTQRVEAETTVREIKLLWEIKDESGSEDKVSAAQRAAKLSQQSS